MNFIPLFLRWRVMIIALLLFIIRPDVTAQVGSSCDSAQLFSSGVSCFNGINSADSVRWFAFDADSVAMRIIVTNTGGPLTAYADRMEIYSGSCSSLTMIGMWNKAPADSVLIADTTTYTIGNRYYVRVVHQQQPTCSGCDPHAKYNICKMTLTPIPGGGWNPPEYYETCGLKFSMNSIQMNRRVSPAANPATGAPQPRGITLASLSPNSQVIRAYLYFICVGNTASSFTFTVTSPTGVVTTQLANFTRGMTNSATGWGNNFNNTTTGYKADLTTLVQLYGNGTYIINGLPANTTAAAPNKTDTDGATLFVIYSDACTGNQRKGKIWLCDGLKQNGGNQAQTLTINGTSYANNINGGAFCGIGDVESVAQNNTTKFAGTTIQDNFYSSPFLGSGFAPFTNTYNASWFNNKPDSGDCSAIVFYGIYFQDGDAYCGIPQAVDAGPTQHLCIGKSYVLPAWSVGFNGPCITAGLLRQD